MILIGAQRLVDADAGVPQRADERERHRCHAFIGAVPHEQRPVAALADQHLDEIGDLVWIRVTIGRQVVTGGEVILIKHTGFAYLGNGYLFAVPFTAIVALLLHLTAHYWLRRTASSIQPANSQVLSCAFSLCG